jgi:hypothetical protein
MKNVFLFFMAIVIGICFSFSVNAAEVKRPGMHYRGWFPPPAVTDPKADYTGGIAPAIADNIRGGNGKGDNKPPAVTPKKVVFENYSNHDIMIELFLEYFPTWIDAQGITQTIGIQNIPGYEPRTIRVPKKSYIIVNLMPGEWGARVYNLSRRTGHNLELNTSVHVDVLPGNQVSSLAATNCDVLWFYR